MKRMVFELAPGDVAALTFPVIAKSRFAEKQIDVEILIEVRTITDGRAEIVLIGPTEGDPA